MSEAEVWLRGALPGYIDELQPVAHSLLQVREEIQRVAALPPEKLWARPGGAASIGFHLKHLAGSLDRLLTYAGGKPLSPAQYAALAGEERESAESAQTLVDQAQAAIDRALTHVRTTPLCTLDEAREVGRDRLPSTVLGLLFHAAEHAQRHAAQIITTAKVVSVSQREWLRDLYRHQEWADAEHWRLLAGFEPARNDEGVRARLHHIHMVQHAFRWILGDRTSPIVITTPADFSSFDALHDFARAYHAQVDADFDALTDERLMTSINIEWFKDPPLSITVAEALTQCVMHSQHHRGQNAARLRELGGVPENTDYIVWLWEGTAGAGVVTSPTRDNRSPTPALLVGLIVTLAAVVGVSWYPTRQISGLRALQTDLADRNRTDSLQLLRIQNDLNSLGLAMRDMLDTTEPYPLTAWTAQFARIRGDLDSALAREAEVAGARRTPEQSAYLGRSLAQFWDAADRIFALAAGGREADAREQIRLSLQARQAALNTAVARLLVENNASEEETAAQVRDIYRQVQRQVYIFLGATFIAIALTSSYLIRANRQLFARLSTLSNDRRELAQQLIATRESTLREISRELHDEFGQVLTAMGSMLGRAGKHAPDGSPLRAELREIGEIAQTTLDNVRGLSQTLHPSILEEAGLERTVDWYLSTVERQMGLTVTYERPASPVTVDSEIGIHVYRVLQESLSNVARHSGVTTARVRLDAEGGVLQLDVEDHGKGIGGAPARRGLGIVAMRERAALVGGTIEFLDATPSGTLIRMRVPIHG